ncbi:fructose-bisphosphate aldolase class II [Halanaerobium saccharolyticum]|uniref:Fructose-bisphosphate aldolase class II n=1 Tax=Halanaerobium saccharolyticum TaxID=43595 RepID=A0A4R7Z192_9FIRM|nr:class II fructose-1,6-bisphosphate aldolase [Halanaerobium saccharolyticum]RAK07831.1 fructose-bisphosphate aldolase class II [Halanaerobium saccharolyticum]TDW04445.1 fructose-bisphosphate aldolase class II [Halanaerobium saccharolyticum]TDX59781.1 fructose-bisphosphate aldolase class II [Halanaerobium saccharolyticum]
MNLKPMKELLQEAHKKNYAVGAFNINNMEFLQAFVAGAEKMNAPLILQVSERIIPYIGLDNVSKMTEAIIKDVSIPVALHLDHGSKFTTIMEAIKVGFSSVMIDASTKEFKENIKLTKKVVEAAHSVGVSVEAELGTIAGTEDGHTIEEKNAMYTNPDKAKEFVEKTGVDALAVAVGTAHGVYKGKPELDFERLEKIKKLLDMPLVLHGASGVSDQDLMTAVKCGVNKVNFNTDFQQAFTKRVKEILAADPEVYDVHTYCGPGRDAVIEKVKEKIRILGSFNKSYLK